MYNLKKQNRWTNKTEIRLTLTENRSVVATGKGTGGMNEIGEGGKTSENVWCLECLKK